MRSRHGNSRNTRIWFVSTLLSGALCVACLLPFANGAMLDETAEHDQKTEFFESRIRPVLVRTCYECHNSQELAEGGLAADYRDGLRKGGNAGAIIKPGDAAGSRLIAILRHEIDDLKMPQGGPRLDDAVIRDFEQWINDGAVDPRETPPTVDELRKLTSWESIFEERKQWWSFQPIKNVSPPIVPGLDDSPIDAFITATQQQQGLAMNTIASPETLVRRLYFVITGLPPRSAELQHWTARLQEDMSATPGSRVAIRELADHLLNTPQFGERWARHWMDWIRYADSHGSEGDPVIEGAWRYRDYLIRALNQDVPVDQLIIEHIAGDLLPAGRESQELGINESMIGPSHWRMVFHGFAPTDALEERMRFTDDEINAFSKAFMGITLSCARCHDHKFDAISQKDYYAVYGILDSCRPGRNIIDTKERLNTGREELSVLRGKIGQQVSALWLNSCATLAQQLRDGVSGGQPREVDPKSVLRDFGAMRAAQPAASEFAAWCLQRTAVPKATPGTVLFDAARPESASQWNISPAGFSQVSAVGTFVLSLQDASVVDRVLPPGFYSHLLSTKDPARLTSPDIQLDQEYDLWVEAAGDAGATLRYVVQNYPRNGTVYPVTRLTPEWTWHRFDLSYWKGDTVHVELTNGRDAPLLVEGSDRSWFGLRRAVLVPRGQEAPATDARSELSALDQSIREKPPATPEEFVQRFISVLTDSIVNFGQGKATAEQAALIQACLRDGLLSNSADQTPELKELLQQWRSVEAGILVPTRVPGLEENKGADRPLFVRGNHKQPADLVPRRFLEAIDPQPYQTEQSGRLELARDIVANKNPLTRRVLVNRIWHHAFGRGIVRTPDNFGRLGQTATHPEMLDWLANDFAMNHWSIKSLLRKIVTSETWLQDSQPSAAAREKDPDNLYLSHYPLRRLEGEAIRDSLLQVSGTLDATMFGPPVSGGSRRRSVYVEVRRNSLDPFLRAFDFPEPFSTAGRRDETNVPAQSLTLMNDPAIRALAESFAQRLLNDPAISTEADRIESLYLNTLSRKPSTAEVNSAVAYFQETRRFVGALAQEKLRLELRNKAIHADLQTLVDPIRTQLLADKKAQPATEADNIPSPKARWTFDENGNDVIGTLNLQLVGGSRIEGGALVLQESLAHAISPPLPFGLKEKSLEAWVLLDSLDQQGGGVLTVQTSDGTYFDSIVIGEQQPRHWLAGSNFFDRTQPFGGIPEESANQTPVHIVLVYATNGEVRAYRNGELYGKPYKSNGPKEFLVGSSVISLGLRHLPAGGNRLLKGRILDAAIYDVALTGAQVEAAAHRSTEFVSTTEVVAAMSPKIRATYDSLLNEQADLQKRLMEMESIPLEVTDAHVWTDLVHSVFCMKEFVYLK